MKLDQETLKKNHFWILLGLVPVFVLAAVLAISASVGAAIATKTKDVEAAQKEIDSKSAVKSDPLIKLLDKQRDELEVKKVDLWKENWERQIGVSWAKGPDGKAEPSQDPNRNLMKWPNSPLLTRFEYTPEYATDKLQLKFGDRIPSPTGDELNQFKVREVYLAQFSNARPGFPGTGMADKVAPTEFLSGWQGVLRHIYFPPVGVTGANGWGDRVPRSEQIWLAMEDIWVQRALLGQVKAVNDQIGTFARAPLSDANNRPVDSPTHRAFASRLWRVELKLVPDEKDRHPVLVGRIKNLTDRLQPLGLGSRMTLNVWLSSDPNARPFPFHVGGEFLRGGEEKDIVRAAEHDIPEGFLPGGIPQAVIARVEQVFDTRTVPVRRIDAVALGYKDSRHALMPLVQPKFEAYEKEAAAADAGATATGMPMGGAGGPPPAAGGPPPSFRGSGESPGMTGGAAGAGAGGTVETVIEANRKRYVEVTEQVRRMPVAITVIVDQAYIQDVLIAYANSPLRFQTTQVHWQRFRGNLGGSGPGGPGETGYGEGGVVTSGQGVQGAGFGGAGEGGSGGLSRPFGFGRGSGGFPGGSGFPGGGPGGPGGPMGSGLAPTPPVFGMPMGSGSMPMGSGSAGGAFGPGGTMTSISEGQLTAGLVELTLYGIVSLYEKYQAPAAEGAGTTPAP